MTVLRYIRTWPKLLEKINRPENTEIWLESQQSFNNQIW